MHQDYSFTKAVIFAVAIIPLFIFSSSPVNAGHEHEADETVRTTKTQLVLPIMSVDRGRKLFVSKGCVACHSVNGVGGHDAPEMDDHINLGLINPFDFVAKMWNHAPGMIAAQEEAFGEAITFTGQEISDIIAFVHDDDAQHQFTENDLTASAREMMNHEHGAKAAPAAHAEEIGHGHEDAPDAAPHKD